jgi:hypothetical protein
MSTWPYFTGPGAYCDYTVAPANAEAEGGVAGNSARVVVDAYPERQPTGGVPVCPKCETHPDGIAGGAFFYAVRCTQGLALFETLCPILPSGRLLLARQPRAHGFVAEDGFVWFAAAGDPLVGEYVAGGGRERFLYHLVLLGSLVLLVGVVMKFAMPGFVVFKGERFSGLLGNPNGMGIYGFMFFCMVTIINTYHPRLFSLYEK